MLVGLKNPKINKKNKRVSVVDLEFLKKKKNPDNENNV